jgi:hypothetical protein
MDAGALFWKRLARYRLSDVSVSDRGEWLPGKHKLRTAVRDVMDVITPWPKAPVLDTILTTPRDEDAAMLPCRHAAKDCFVWMPGPSPCCWGGSPFSWKLELPGASKAQGSTPPGLSGRRVVEPVVSLPNNQSDAKLAVRLAWRGRARPSFGTPLVLSYPDCCKCAVFTLRKGVIDPSIQGLSHDLCAARVRVHAGSRGGKSRRGGSRDRRDVRDR